MTLKTIIDADLKTALLAGNKLVAEVLRGLKSAILYEEVAKKVRETGLADEQIEVLIARESKKRDESAELFDKGGNHESAEKERAEKVILAKYLPARLSEVELAAVVEQVVAELQPEGMKDMGRVIGAAKAKVGNGADGAMLAQMVKARLS